MYTQEYAGDLVVILTGNFPIVLYDLTQTVLVIVEKWYKEVNLPVYASKKEMILITSQLIYNASCYIYYFQYKFMVKAFLLLRIKFNLTRYKN